MAAVAGLAAVALAPFARPARAAASPRLEIAPARLTFSTPGESHALTLTNVGGDALHTGNLSFVSAGARRTPFVVDAPAGRTLGPGQSAVVNVTYRPLAGAPPAQVFAALLVPADDPELPRDVDLQTGAAGERRIAGVALVAGETHLLTWIVFLPLLGAALLGLGPAGWPRYARSVACLAAGLPLALAAVGVACFNPTTTVADGNYGAQLIAHAPLVRALGVEYFVGVDGLSALLLLLAPVVGVASVALTRSSRADGDARGPLAALLVAQAGATGVFVALDGVLLWLFWLLAVAGVVALERSRAPAGSRRGLSGFARPGLASVVLLLLALVALHGEAGATYLCDGTPVRHTFDLLKMARANDFVGKGAAGVFGLSFATIVWVGLFVAFALALGVPPFGARSADDAGGAASWALLVGVVSKMGLYGLARFNLGLLPETTRAAAPALATFGVVAAVIAALLATRAPDLRRLVARAGGARTALAVVGLAALTPAGISGALAVALAGGLTVALALAVLVALEGRASSETPARLAPWVTFALLASLATPGLATFVGPALIVVDASTRHPALALVALAALVVGAGAHARLLRPVLARATADQRRAGVEQGLAGVEVEDAPLDHVSLAVVVSAVVLLVALGLVPALALDKAAAGVLDLVHRVTAAPS